MHGLSSACEGSAVPARVVLVVGGGAGGGARGSTSCHGCLETASSWLHVLESATDSGEVINDKNTDNPCVLS